MQLFDNRTEFYQYDTNQRLICDECKVGEEIHFSNTYYAKAAICLTYEYEGLVVVNVPNDYLLRSGELTVYRMYINDDGRNTVDKYTFNVLPRKKPSDYVYTETEVKSIEKIITDALDEAKESGEFDGKDGYTPQKGIDYFDGEDGSDANVTAESIKTALGYTPANAKDVSKLSEEIDEVRNLRRHINCVGMSIWWYDGNQLNSSGYRGGVIAKGYQTLLKQRYNFNGLTNYCYSGNSLGGLTDDDSNSILSYTYSWTGNYGDIWLLDSITNDFKRNIPIGDFWTNYAGKTGKTTYYGALKAFEEKVRALSGKHAIIIVANACRRNNDGYTSTSTNTVGHTLLDYEQALLNVASWNDWLFVDQYRCSLTDEAVPWATIDGLHLNNFGYKLAIRPWYECIDTLIERNGDIVDVELTEYQYLGNTGEVYTAVEQWFVSDFVPVKYYERYRYTGITSIGQSNVVCVVGYDSNRSNPQVVIGHEDCSNGLSFDIPDNVSYIKFSGNTTNNTLELRRI